MSTWLELLCALPEECRAGRIGGGVNCQRNKGHAGDHHAWRWHYTESWRVFVVWPQRQRIRARTPNARSHPAKQA